MTCAMWLLGYKYFVHFSIWTKCRSDRCPDANISPVLCTSEVLLERYRCDPAKIYFTTRYTEWNVHPQLWFWVRTTKHATERTNLSKLWFHYTA